MALTTPGALLIKHMIPTKEGRDKFDIYTPIDKPAMTKLVNILLEHGGPTSHEVINDMGKMFFNKATEIGATTPLSDYENDSDERQAMFGEFEHKVTEVLKKNLSAKDQAKELDAISGQMRGKMEKHNFKAQPLL